MEKKALKIGLIPKLIIAIILGILFGSFLPEWFNRVIVTCSSIFSTFLSFIIPLMIVAYVTMGIANLRSGAGKLLHSSKYGPKTNPVTLPLPPYVLSQSPNLS